MTTPRANDRAPRISLLFPTHGRPEAGRNLLERLARQTVDPGDFEVVVVDDGGTPEFRLPDGLPFACTLIRQENAGPAAARNRGLREVRAPYVLILNDDAVPAEDLVERHLAAHAELGDGVAVLGTFGFTEESLRSPFTRLLETSDLLFGYTRMEHGGRYGWTEFWTCNISLRTDAIREVGGFDAERFDRAICEDVELGVRLCKLRGMDVVFREDCVAHHDHTLDPRGYMARMFQLGRYQYRLGDKFGEPGALFPENALITPALRAHVLALEPDAYAMVDTLEELEREYAETAIPEHVAADAKVATRQHSHYFWLAGLLYELTGEDVRREAGAARGAAPAPAPAPASATPRTQPAPTPATSRTTITPAPRLERTPPAAGVGLPPRDPSVALSIVVVSCDALAKTRRTIEALHRAADARFPQEIIVVDNGSTDGSVDWLRAQDHVQLIENGANHGAPRARNQGLARAAGAWVAFFDNDVVVPRSWVARTLEHGLFDPTVGAIPLVANRASKRQVVPYDGDDTDASIERFANVHYGRHAGESEDATLFTSLAVVLRREVLERIGGFDEAFSPWGFEDDDIALRVRLAGWRNRVARDSFVYHMEYESQVKHERHAAWMQDNWDAFLAKWSPAAAGAALFDYERVRVPQPGEATEAQLVFPLPGEGAAPPAFPSPTAPPAPLPRTAPAPSPTSTPDMRVDAPAPPAGAANVIVMGSGHSGAGLATVLLADAGWCVCGDAVEDRAATPRISSASEEIRGINEYLLAARVTNEAPLGPMQHWLALAPDPIDFEVDRALRARMDRFTADAPFALQDPRLCYTLDAWRPSLGDARFVCVFREPAATAAGILAGCANDDDLRDVEVDVERAVAIWDAMYRRILDGHANEGEWLFVHADELRTPEGLARVEAFVGAPLNADLPVARSERSTSDAPVPARVARIYAELCARSGIGADAAPIAVIDEAPGSTYVSEPELTVLVRTDDRKDTLQRCLASFEEQTARGRYEIVVVDDGSTDGTAEMLAARTQRAPTRIVHTAGAGTSAALNAGLRVSRGDLVLLCGDDTIAPSDLVERHLAAHARVGRGHAVLGSLEQPRAALDNALARVLERTDLVPGLDTTDPAELHDWTRFRTGNISVSLDDVRAVGMFDEDLPHHACGDADLGVRLERECGTRVVYDPTARAEHARVLTFDDLAHRSRAVAAAFVGLFHEHPELLSHEAWRGRAHHSVAAHERFIVETYPQRARAEAYARELSRVDLGALERSGQDGATIARVLAEQLEAHLVELGHLWWAEGELEGMRAFGVDRMSELLSARRRAEAERAAAAGPALAG